jgi:dCMP deaminase
MRIVPSWDQYFMSIAKAISVRSKDPMTQVGAILVDSNNHIIGTGYNGFEPGVIETKELWQRPTKYQYVKHAERNCIKYCIKETKGATLYSSLFPCSECAILIRDAEIRKVYYSDSKYENEITKKIFKENNIELIQCILI